MIILICILHSCGWPTYDASTNTKDIKNKHLYRPITPPASLIFLQCKICQQFLYLDLLSLRFFSICVFISKHIDYLSIDFVGTPVRSGNKTNKFMYN